MASDFQDHPDKELKMDSPAVEGPKEPIQRYREFVSLII
jgi:hypothetical protein